jgi:SRSO17 transposase
VVHGERAVVEGAPMAMEMTADLKARLHEFFDKRIGQHLGRPEQRASFATYAHGIVGDGERKSVEPIAARATADPRECKQMHDRLLYFVGRSPWSDRLVRREAALYALEALQAQEPVTTWIIDDTGFLKQGTHSVGVQRQYTGSAGKIANCQIGVSLSIATRNEHLPIDFELYLPKSWTEDPVRRAEAHIPEHVVFKTKTELAMDLISRAVDARLPGEIVLMDSAYGDSSDLRNVIRTYGLDIGVAIKALTKVWLLDAAERRRGDPIGVQQLGIELGPKAFRQITWRDGTLGARKKLRSRFCFRRVKVAHDDGTEAADREPLWLVIEWPENEERPTKFVLTSLPRRLSKKQIVRIIKERWRTERAYEDLKGEFGLDHFEGRSFPGWHHHVSVVLCCYAFVVAERVRHFPPSARRIHRDAPVRLAA